MISNCISHHPVSEAILYPAQMHHGRTSFSVMIDQYMDSQLLISEFFFCAYKVNKIYFWEIVLQIFLFDNFVE